MAVVRGVVAMVKVKVGVDWVVATEASAQESRGDRGIFWIDAHVLAQRLRIHGLVSLGARLLHLFPIVTTL